MVFKDHSSTIGNAGKTIQPTPQRRRRLVQKKYLTSDDDDEDDVSDDKKQEREILEKLQGAVIDLTYSDLEEELPQARQPRVRARGAISEDEDLESWGGGAHAGAILT